MRFSEHFERMDLDCVNKLNKAWRLIDTDTESKVYFEDHVLNPWLKNGQFQKALTCEEHDKFIGQKVREYLKYRILGFQIFDPKIEQELREKCIIVQNEVLDDFAEMMIKYVKSKAIVTIEDEPTEVISTPFLKLILMINYVYCNKLEFDEIFKRVDVESGLISKEDFKNYLNIRQILTDNKKVIDTTKLSEWITNETESIQDFYKFIMIQINGKDIPIFLNLIIKTFNNSDDWILIEEFEKIFKKFEKEVQMGIQLGLVIIKEYKEKTYMQLSPEGWFLATGTRPTLWDKKEVLLTPLKEVFVPFNFDPFVIQKLDYFDCSNTGKKGKIKIYRDDYFIVSKISVTQGIRDLVKITELARCIKKYCVDIPDVVRDDFIG